MIEYLLPNDIGGAEADLVLLSQSFAYPDVAVKSTVLKSGHIGFKSYLYFLLAIFLGKIILCPHVSVPLSLQWNNNSAYIIHEN